MAPNAYPLGLSLRLREEVPAQTSLKLGLIAELTGREGAVTAQPAAMERLRKWIASLPVTGRVPVVSADGRWLQTNPVHDPLLVPGYSVVMPDRPRTLSVIRADGTLCQVVHVAGREAKDYVEACRGGGARSDWAWIAQPDGRIQRAGVALWNEHEQDEPAAGAWIWAPGRQSGWPDAFSERLIRFLATQGPAPDSPAASRSGDALPVDTGGTSSGMSQRSAVHEKQDAHDGSNAEAKGMALGGGMSMHLSEMVPAQHSPGSPSRLPALPEPLMLREESRTPRSRNLAVSSSDWGTVGLLQTPTARMREAGTLSLNYTRVRPYGHGNTIFQPFDWLEAGFRYTEVSNRLYGPAELSGDQSYKDKSIDAKFKLWDESAYVPQVALGLRDVGGTGFFAGEYVVANKRTGDFDWSLGLGWGYVGARGDLPNPLRVFGRGFDTRGSDVGQGGEFALKSYFRGRTALFGGVQYQTPWEPLTVKVEYDGNDYAHEPRSNNQKQGSRFNVGLVYRAFKGVDVTVGLERGNTVMFGLTVQPNLARLSQPKVSDPRPVPVTAARPTDTPDWSATARDFNTQTDWKVRSIDPRENEVRVVVEEAGSPYWRDKVDRAAAVLHRDSPAKVERFVFTYRTLGTDIAEHVVDRDAWVRERVAPVPSAQRQSSIMARDAEGERGRGDEPAHMAESKDFDHGMRLSYAQILGGPDAFVLWQLGLVETARWRIRDDTWLQGTVRLRLADNYAKFKYTAPSNLPRVRTFQREFAITSRVTIPNLQLSHVGRIAPNQFYGVYGGMLEEMYGGVGGEWLYRPFASRIGFGIDVNAVRMREFEQHLGFQDYRITTGHATLYWDTGWQDVLATLHVGRYLAGDVGATIQLARVFRNGVTMGAFATKTNVSAAEFGEGSFDKGVFISIPFDTVFTRSSRGAMSTLWRPLTRDGGAMLNRSVHLWTMTSPRSDRTLWYRPAPLPDEMLKATERRAEYSKTPEVIAPYPGSRVEPYTREAVKVPAAEWERNGSLNEMRLEGSLYAQQFRNVAVDYDPTHRVLVEASHDTLRPLGRAVGRAARTALLQAPLEARGISVTIARGASPQARYEFFDLDRLRKHLNGEIGADALRDYVKIEWINPAARVSEPLAGLNDIDPEVKSSPLATLVPESVSVSRVANDFVNAGHTAARTNWLDLAVAGAGLTIASAYFDERAHRQAERRAGTPWFDRGIKIGNALPLLGAAAAGAMALDGSDPRRSRTGFAALEAGATAYVAATGLKYVVGRARPNLGLGYREFNWGTSEDAYGSFPSRHTTVAWALATPFALEYDMPWLYGVAALTNLARIGSREHWVSDTVASSVLGYGIGRVFWRSGRDNAKRDPKVHFDGSSLNFLWDW
ncbi:MAG TPA: YjbH domain-containing protein [Burkholderiales bacterium]|nr:YjbH domain-containing protein [Burkholderiales bacterium]